MPFINYSQFRSLIKEREFSEAFKLKFNAYDRSLARRLPESKDLWHYIKTSDHRKKMIDFGFLPPGVSKTPKIPDIPKGKLLTLKDVEAISRVSDFGMSKPLTRKVFDALPSDSSVATETLTKKVLALGGIDLRDLPLKILNRKYHKDFLFFSWVEEAEPKDNAPLPKITDLLDPLQVYPIRPLGMGSYGAVFIVWVWGYGKCVLKVSNTDQTGYGPDFECKYTRFLQCIHPNVLCAKLCFEDTKHNKGFFTDYFEGYADLVKWSVCLHEVLGKGKTVKDPKKLRQIQSLIATVFRQILEAVKFIHSKGMVHRDIKPENILIKWDVPIIIDFGGAWIPAIGPDSYASFATEGYLPKRLQKKFDDETIMTGDELRWADFWAVGAVLYDVVRGIMTGKMITPNAKRYTDKLKMPIFEEVHEILTSQKMDLSIGDRAILALSKLE